MARHSLPHTWRVAAPLAVASLLTVTLLGNDAQRPVSSDADAATITHVLNRLGFGPRPGDVERVREMGLDKYIEQQLDPDGLADAALDARLAEFTTLEMGTAELARKFFVPVLQMRRQNQARAQTQPQQRDGEQMMTPGAQAPTPDRMVTPEARAAQMASQNVLAELMQAKMLRAVLSEHQLEEVLVDFWFNHFNVFVGKGQVRQYLTEYERDAIRPHVFGKFRDLLGAVAHSPAMLFYLDNWQSAAPAPDSTPLRDELKRRLNDSRLTAEQRARIMQRMQAQGPPNRQRGLNENYARELMELHTLGVDSGYTQNDVVALARIFTGWTIDRPQQGGSFVFQASMHDTGTKPFLGTTFAPAGQSEGERALDLLAKHPSTARHLSFKLAQRFVADAPPPALVDRAAKKFADTGGDLREVVRLIVTSPEFFAAEFRRAKVKTPFEFVVSAVRAVNANVANAQPLVGAMRDLGMPLYGCQPPTGYSMTADAWVNTGALLNRMNFAVQLLDGGRPVPGERGDQRGPRLGAGGAQRQRGQAPIQVDVTAFAPDTSEMTRNALAAKLLASTVSDTTKQTLARAESPRNLIALVLGSPEFQRR